MKSTLFSYYLLVTLTLFKNVFSAGAGSFNGVNPGRSYKATSNHNPIITQKYSADPGVMVYNGRVYVYATNDGDAGTRYNSENTYGQINTINVMSSADLVNWMDHGSIPAAGGGGAARWASNSWAPCAAWKKINGKDKFFLYFANNASGIGVLTADSPTGPFKDPIGRALISRQTPNSNVEWLFDPAVIVDTDGTGYLYYGGGVPQGQNANPRTIRVAKLGNDMTSIQGTPQMIDAPWVFEDSGINKIGNTYVYSYCTNWAGGPYGNARIAYMTSNNPMSGFKYQGTCFNNPGDFFQTTGNNHHTIIEFKNKYYIFYHAEWLNKQILGGQKGYRTTHVDELPVNGSKLGNAKGTLSGVSQLENVNGSALNYAASMAWQSGISVKGQGAVTQVNYGRGSWTGVSNVALGNAKTITLRASSSSGATVKICAGSENGTVLGYVDIPAGGSLQNVTGNLSGASGTKSLFFIASGNLTIESWQLDGNTDNTGNTGNTDNNDNNGDNTGNVDHTPTTDVTDGWYYIKNTGSDKYLQANGSSAGANVEIGSFTGYSDQKWKVTTNGEGYITLLNGNGNFNLDVDSAKNENGANILIYDAYGGVAQQFALTAGSGNSFIITTRVSNGGKAIDVYENRTNDGANVCQWSVNGNSNQTWVFERVDGGSGSGNNNNNNDKTDNTCWAKALGYECCKSCLPVVTTDGDGSWSVVNDDWCGLPTSCKSGNSSTCTGAQGYPCCKSSCAIYSSDSDGDWSIENGDWCLIDKKAC